MVFYLRCVCVFKKTVSKKLVNIDIHRMDVDHCVIARQQTPVYLQNMGGIYVSINAHILDIYCNIHPHIGECGMCPLVSVWYTICRKFVLGI